MMNIKNNSRLDLLYNKFNVFDIDELDSIVEKLDNEYSEIRKLISFDGDILAIHYCNEVNNKVKGDVSVVGNVFNLIVESDPTKNKMYSQWILTMFRRLIKDNKHDEAIRFVVEDLPLAKTYLEIFEGNKRKDKFKKLCSNSFILKGVGDVSDINQYKSLSQLYDAIDPFIERDVSSIERLMNRFVESGDALIPVRDRKFTLYVPLTTLGSELFDSFANWCTCKKGNGMFKHYTRNYKTPYNAYSKIYIIINNKLFDGDINNDSLYQIHFETNQIKDRTNSVNVDIYEPVLSKSDGLTNFFKEELTKLSRGIKSINPKSNNYVKYLINFGITDSLFELYDENTPFVIFKNTVIPKMGDLSKFKNLETLEMTSTKLVYLHPSLFNIKTLEVLVLRNNKLVEIPNDISKLTNLVFINLIGNKIKNIPDSIKYLDKSNGGNLHKIAISVDDIGVDNYNKLKLLLPNVRM